jgi:predicted nucleotidyltransferase
MAITPNELPLELLSSYCRHNDISKLALFGSVLRDDFRMNSDIDMLVEFEPDARVGFMTLARMRRELSELLGRTVDLVPESGLKPLIRDDVLDSAKVLYAA